MAEILNTMPGMTVSAAAKPLRTTNVTGSSSRVRLMSVADLDGRTRSAQRARDLRSQICSDLGGEETLSALKLQLAESVAILSAVIEDAQARYLSGQAGPEILKTLTVLLNARRRDAQLLGLDRVARDITADIDAYISSGGR